MSDYRDIQSAVRAEKFKIWAAWFCGGWIMLGITIAAQDVHILSAITQTLLVVLGVAFTVAAVRMTNALNRKVDKARREVLGDL